MAPTSGSDPTTQVKTCFDCKLFDVANWVACLNGENGPGGTPSHEALSVSPQGALEISSVVGQPPSLDRNHFSTPRVVAESHKRDERCRPSSQRPQYPTLYRRKEVKPSSVTRIVTASAGVQTDLSQVVHSSCRSICHSPEPQSSTVRVSSPRPKCLGHRCSEHKLVGFHCLYLPSHGSPSQGDPKSQAIQLSDHRNSPRLARDALVLGPSAALNRDPTSTTRVKNSSQTVPQLWRWQKKLLPLRGHQQGPSTSQCWPYLRSGAEKIRWISPLPL